MPDYTDRYRGGATDTRAKCRACDAPIIWAVTERGKAMPLDADPDPAGNVIMTGANKVGSNGHAGPEIKVLGNTADMFGGEPEVRYMPHHATCPEVEQFRG